jgi:hypothetical protein
MIQQRQQQGRCHRPAPPQQQLARLLDTVCRVLLPLLPLARRECAPQPR